MQAPHEQRPRGGKPMAVQRFSNGSVSMLKVSEADEAGREAGPRVPP